MSPMHFDAPEWSIVPAAQAIYGNIDNRVMVTPKEGKGYLVSIAVPTGLFKYMKDVMQLPQDEARIFLNEIDNEWVLGLSIQGYTYDLWAYPGLPAWAEA